MKESKSFRVLLIDDKKIVLDRATEIIKYEFELLENTWLIEIYPLYVQVYQSHADGKYYIDEEKTFGNIGDIFQFPFDLIISDFGFRKPDKNVLDKIKEVHGEYFGFTELEAYVLNPKHLVDTGLNQEKSLANDFRKNIKNHKNNLYIYTYIPEEWRKHIQNVDVPGNMTKKTFANANSITILDTRKELFNDKQFEDLKTDGYYAFLISKYLEQIIHLEIAKKAVEDAKYLKQYKTKKAIALIVIFGTVIGVSSEFFGGLSVQFFQKDQYFAGIALIVVNLILILLGGSFLLLLIEGDLKQMLKGLFSD